MPKLDPSNYTLSEEEKVFNLCQNTKDLILDRCQCNVSIDQKEKTVKISVDPSLAQLYEEGLTVKLDGVDFVLNNENTIISIKQKEGYASTSNNKTIVVIDTELTEELILEGLAREFVRKVQSLSKEADFVITDHIKVYYNGSEKLDKMLDMYKEYVMNEVLWDELIKDISLNESCELNDETAYIKVEKI